MSEYRQDRTSGRWVIVAPERGRRPRQWRRDKTVVEPTFSFDPTCPFCPGNEHLLAEIIEQTSWDEAPGWRTRVVANKYPALRPDAAANAIGARDDAREAGYGYHEVIIESPRHDAKLVSLETSTLKAVIESYRRRYTALMARPNIASVVIFRNYGLPAGASLAHPHSQVIASARIPPRQAAAEIWGRMRYEQSGRCVSCEEIEHELDGGHRVVDVTQRFLAIVPFAAESPFEQKILARRHQASFAEMDEEDAAEFGGLLQRALGRMEAVLEGPAYNFFIASNGTAPASNAYSHWALHIVPDLVTPGGFELGAGLPINPSLPEEDAAALRSADVAKKAVE